MSIRILIADDHEIMLDGLRALLEKQADFSVVGVAKDGKEAVDKSCSLAPDVVVMDISMPGLNGIDATRQITAKRPETKVLCLSAHAEPRFVEAMLEANAAGYLLKEYSQESLVQAIRHVIANEVYICPRVGYAVVRALKAERPSAASTVEPLTEREREILQLISEGHSTKDIAERLFLSIKTVGTHREHLMDKLDIHSIAGLTKYAIREGLTDAALG